MIPLVAGLTAIGPISNAMSQIFSSPPEAPSAASFSGELDRAEATSMRAAQPARAMDVANLLQGRSVSQLSPEELKRLGALLVGTQVQMVDAQGISHMGTVGMMRQVGGDVSLNVSGEEVRLGQMQQIQVVG